MSIKFYTFILMIIFVFPGFAQTKKTEPAQKTKKVNFNLGEEYRKKKNYIAAIDYYFKALEEKRSKKSKSQIHFLIATCYYDQTEWDLAIEHYRKSVSLSKKYAQQAYYFIGLSFYAKRNKSDSMKAFEEAVRIDKYPALSISSKTYINRLKAVKETPWAISTSIGYTYDTNTTGESQMGIIADDMVSDEISHSSNMRFNPTYTIALGETVLLDISGNAAGTLYWQRYHRGYDSLEQAGDLSLKFPWFIGNTQLKSTFKTGVGISFAGTRDPSLRWYKMSEKHWGTSFTTNYSPFSWIKFSIPFNFTLFDVVSKHGRKKENDRDGPLYETGAAGTIPLTLWGLETSLKSGYRLSVNDAAGKQKYFQNHKLAFGIGFPLFWGFDFNFSGSWAKRNFASHNKDRREFKYSFNYTLTNNIGDYGIEFGVNHLKNDSTIGANNWRKLMVSTTLSRTF